MKLIDAYTRLLALEEAFIRTTDAAACLGIEKSHASKLLSRLVEAGRMVKVGWGLWAFPERVDVMSLPERLVEPFPAYVSLQSALYYHGIISQMPAVTYAVSPARTRRYNTPLGAVSIHHIDPRFFLGFETEGRHGVKMATPEKALLDFFYLTPAKTRLFTALPELELPSTFSFSRTHKMIEQIPSQRLRTLALKRLEATRTVASL
ncbi:MAG: type IV toxin-antitoxin system AbiEi family antitoxin domain-containing protein [Verrucomicrobia bacterium]|nr:type IV toxin-antitoxin system AbiEi family antitoxin domain-containing protein [Verrucomicrobiota bacterium]